MQYKKYNLLVDWSIHTNLPALADIESEHLMTNLNIYKWNFGNTLNSLKYMTLLLPILNILLFYFKCVWQTTQAYSHDANLVTLKQFYWRNLQLKYQVSSIFPLKHSTNWKQTLLIGIYIYAASNFQIPNTGTILFAIITSVNMLIKHFINGSVLFCSITVTQSPASKSFELLFFELSSKPKSS